MAYKGKSAHNVPCIEVIIFLDSDILWRPSACLPVHRQDGFHTLGTSGCRHLTTHVTRATKSNRQELRCASWPQATSMCTCRGSSLTVWSNFFYVVSSVKNDKLKQYDKFENAFENRISSRVLKEIFLNVMLILVGILHLPFKNRMTGNNQNIA